MLLEADADTDDTLARFHADALPVYKLNIRMGNDFRRWMQIVEVAAETRPFVRDDKGNIRTFFHRSDADFDRFKRIKVKDKPKWRLSGEGGFYFSPTKPEEFYGKNEYVVALRASNPYQNMMLDTTKLSRSFIAKLQAQGYDSIDSPNYGEFIVFNPDQIQIISKNGRPVLTG